MPAPSDTAAMTHLQPGQARIGSRAADRCLSWICATDSARDMRRKGDFGFRYAERFCLVVVVVRRIGDANAVESQGQV